MNWQRALRPLVRTAVREAMKAARTSTDRSRPRRPGPSPQAPAPTTGDAYPGDFTGPLDPVYAPEPDGEPDPGEIVWTWVPYEEDHGRGKDRPVLLVGHDGPWLLALQLTSKDHDRDEEQERRAGRRWVDIGSGPWDSRGRPSEVRVNRVVRVAPAAVRREGAVLDRARFEEVAAAVRAATG
ncbi:type II toxin-antitoxin system PemK/MazF family toxin [Phycicoccus sp. BSK3Z-2]|uniref:Type II toxin-antitoxin system PemK/MazF family toxin n=1 Tax=Phycicoccus avicenniae TaxID=2828860 RepID=A0A941I1J9_9MICO|nr:type II toxin-antitoxin system PemK/MazF family toxin [Phycicoccus avicenniae]MBR7744139.1 type II toxin-antitoxin system PemK/MazF family toxin [Phycicoccus avicenniae]